MDDKRLMDQGWAEMHTLLDVEMPTEKKRRRLVAWLFAGLLIMVLIVIGVTTILSDNTRDRNRVAITGDSDMVETTTAGRIIVNQETPSIKPSATIGDIASNDIVSEDRFSSNPSSAYGAAASHAKNSTNQNIEKTAVSNSFTDRSTSMANDVSRVVNQVVTDDMIEVQVMDVEFLSPQIASIVGIATPRQPILSGSGKQATIENLDIEQLSLVQPPYFKISEYQLGTGQIAYSNVITQDDIVTVRPYAFAQGIFSSSSSLYALGGGVSFSKKSNNLYAGLGLLNTRYQDAGIASDSETFEDVGSGDLSSIVTPMLNPRHLGGYAMEMGYDRSLSAKFKVGVRADYLSLRHEQSVSNEATNSRSGGTYLYDAVQRQIGMSPTITYSPWPQLSLQFSLRQPIIEQRFTTELDFGATAFPTALAIPRAIRLDIPRSAALALRYTF